MPETNGNVNPVSQSAPKRNEAKFFENGEQIFAGAEPLRAGFGLLHFNKSLSRLRTRRGRANLQKHR